MHYISFHLVKFDLRESALPNVNLELIYLVQTQQSVHRALITVLQEIKAKNISFIKQKSQERGWEKITESESVNGTKAKSKIIFRAFWDEDDAALLFDCSIQPLEFYWKILLGRNCETLTNRDKPDF